MATRSRGRKSSRRNASAPAPARARPTFPYTSRPNALRRFLTEVPRRPRPGRVNGELLASWGMAGGENQTIIRVLKALNLVNDNNEATDTYTEFMRAGAGPAVLGAQIRRVYAPLFGATLHPERENPESLRNLFNIHSSGAASTIDYQIQTFRALCDNADLDAGAVPPLPSASSGSTAAPQTASLAQIAGGEESSPSVNINLHIHLPENKTSRDYQYIIQDIARFIYGRGEGAPDAEGRTS